MKRRSSTSHATLIQIPPRWSPNSRRGFSFAGHAGKDGRLTRGSLSACDIVNVAGGVGAGLKCRPTCLSFEHGLAAPIPSTRQIARCSLASAIIGFNLNCLPCCCAGPLKTAPVVLLFLSPGLGAGDEAEAKTEQGQARYAKMRSGDDLLPEDDR